MWVSRQWTYNCEALELSIDPTWNWPGPTPNSAFRRGSFLDLPFPDASFDCVLQQNVFHHVTGASVAQNHANLRRCVLAWRRRKKAIQDAASEAPAGVQS